MLNEASLRRPTFSLEDSVAVVMADGQEWFLRRPVLRLRPKFAGGRATSSTMQPFLEGGSELVSLLEAITADGDFVQAAINIGAYLLGFNYDLADEHLEELFSFPASCDGEIGWMRQIVQIANGVDVPKAPTSGGDAVSS